MADHEASAEGTGLQFDWVVSEATVSPSPGRVAVECSACRTSIDTEYYQINDRIVCGRCRSAIESFAETPTGALPFARAGLFGVGAGLAGAIIYYAVIAIAHLEIGIVAILIGYMVGAAVRKGAGGRGGLRFQVLALLLTYASVAMAYTPIAIQAIANDEARSAAAPAVDASPASPAVRVSESTRAQVPPTARQFLFAMVALTAFIAVLPILIIVGSLPFGLISALIIFVGMRQAWRMTRAAVIDVLGPYRVGGTPMAPGV